MNSQAKFDSSLDYSDLVAELRSGEDGLEYASADALEALMARIAELEAALNGLMVYGCPACNGDCSAANPPVIGCPMEAARAALEKKND